MSKVLILCDSSTSELKKYSGPAMRAIGMTDALRKKGHDVTLAFQGETKPSNNIGDIPIINWNKNNLNVLTQKQDVVIVPPLGAASYKYFKIKHRIPTVVDLYCPFLIEYLYLTDVTPNGYAWSLSRFIRVMRTGDFFICSNEMQRAYYLGMMNLLGRINPLSPDGDLIKVVPSGIPNESPIKTKAIFRGKLVNSNDPVLLWPGGIYPWFDFKTALNGFLLAQRELSNLRFIIVGGKNPNDPLGDNGFDQSFELAKKTGLIDKNIFFIGWQPYSERANYYLESDIAVCTSKSMLESLLSFRTRILDTAWAGLPCVISSGDDLGKLFEAQNACMSVPEGDPEALSKVFIELLNDPKKRLTLSYNCKEVANKFFNWEKVIEPLHKFCLDPKFADDMHLNPAQSAVKVGGVLFEYKMLSKVTLDYMQKNGLRRTITKIRKYSSSIT